MQEWQEKIERRLEKLEQRTEEMKALRVDVHNVDVEAIKQELHTVSDTWLNTLQEHYDEHKQDIANVQKTISDVQTVQKGHLKFFEEHGKRLSQMATKDELKSELSAMATKDDLATMKNEILDAMKQLFQQKSGE
jgi:hypothetical protein